jgi:hypothetical protein
MAKPARGVARGRCGVDAHTPLRCTATLTRVSLPAAARSMAKPVRGAAASREGDGAYQPLPVRGAWRPWTSRPTASREVYAGVSASHCAEHGLAGQRRHARALRRRCTPTFAAHSDAHNAHSQAACSHGGLLATARSMATKGRGQAGPRRHAGIGAASSHCAERDLAGRRRHARALLRMRVLMHTRLSDAQRRSLAQRVSQPASRMPPASRCAEHGQAGRRRRARALRRACTNASATHRDTRSHATCCRDGSHCATAESMRGLWPRRPEVSHEGAGACQPEAGSAGHYAEHGGQWRWPT